MDAVAGAAAAPPARRSASPRFEPRRQRLRVPAGHLAVRRWHVRCHFRVAPFECALGVADDALSSQEQLDCCMCHAHIDPRPGLLTRHRVVVAIDFDVIADADPRHLPFGVFVVLLRQCSQGRLVHLGEGTGAAAGQHLEGALVQVGQQRCRYLFSSSMLKKRRWRRRAST